MLAYVCPSAFCLMLLVWFRVAQRHPSQGQGVCQWRTWEQEESPCPSV